MTFNFLTNENDFEHFDGSEINGLGRLITRTITDRGVVVEFSSDEDIYVVAIELPKINSITAPTKFMLYKIVEDELKKISTASVLKAKEKHQLYKYVNEVFTNEDLTDLYEDFAINYWSKCPNLSKEEAIEHNLHLLNLEGHVDYIFEDDKTIFYIVDPKAIRNFDNVVGLIWGEIIIHLDSQAAEQVGYKKLSKLNHQYYYKVFVDGVSFDELDLENPELYMNHQNVLSDNFEKVLEKLNITIKETEDEIIAYIPKFSLKTAFLLKSAIERGYYGRKHVKYVVDEWGDDWEDYETVKKEEHNAFPINFRDINSLPNIENFTNFFSYCQNFNPSKPLVLPDSCRVAKDMFDYCINFNAPVIINDGCENIETMFSKCSKFNKQLIIPESVKNADGCFEWCYDLKKKPIIKSPNVVLEDLSIPESN